MKKLSLLLLTLLLLIIAVRSDAFQVIKLGSEVTGTLPVTNGGTGLTSPGTSGNVLMSDGGGGWFSGTPSGGTMNYVVDCSTSLPSATGSGKTYWCNNSPVSFIDDPTSVAWVPFATQYFGGTPGIGSMTAYGDVAINSLGGTVFALNKTSGGVTSGSALAAGSLSSGSAWSVTTHLSCTNSIAVSYLDCGVTVSAGATAGSSSAWSILRSQDSGYAYMMIVNHTLGGNRLASPVFYNYADSQFLETNYMHFRILNDGTITHFQQSTDGILWIDFYGASAISSLDHYGVTIGAEYSGSSVGYVQSIVLGLKLSSSLTQQTITGATGSGVPVQVTVASTSGFMAGDLVSVNGMVGNTAANVAAGSFDSPVRLIKSIDSSTQLTLGFANSSSALNGNGTWTSGGVITLVSR